ncbi:MAG: hypothetical protein ACOCRZ_07885 [Halothermotrichaceae bacterium]
MEDNVEVAIIAGTEIDTKMGVAYFENKGIKAIGGNISKEPATTSSLQILSPEKLKNIMLKKIRKLIRNHLNIKVVCIYCNSLSTSVNLEELKKEVRIPIVTPLETYRYIGKKHDIIGVLAANCQATAGIENVIHSVNESAQVIGIAALKLVLAIEDGMPPGKILKKFSLDSIFDFFGAVETEKIILGCTHFPYFEDQLSSISEIPIFNPSERMYQLVSETLKI